MTKREGEAPFSYDGLDRVMHEKARLGVLSSLVAHPKGAGFFRSQAPGRPDRRQSFAVIWQVLQEAGLVEITKSHDGTRPLTSCALTRNGRRRFLDYLAVLEQVVRDAAAPAGADFNLARSRKRLSTELFLTGDFVMQSTQRMQDKPGTHVAVIMDGNRR